MVSCRAGWAGRALGAGAAVCRLWGLPVKSRSRSVYASVCQLHFKMWKEKGTSSPRSLRADHKRFLVKRPTECTVEKPRLRGSAEPEERTLKWRLYIKSGPRVTLSPLKKASLPKRNNCVFLTPGKAPDLWSQVASRTQAWVRGGLRPSHLRSEVRRTASCAAASSGWTRASPTGHSSTLSVPGLREGGAR